MAKTNKSVHQEKPRNTKYVKQARPNNRKVVHEDLNKYYELFPSWVFGQMDYNGPFGWSNIINNPDSFRDILSHLSNLESMKWREILLDSKKQNHSIELYKLSKEAQSRLNHINIIDIDELISLRVTSKIRLFGIMNSGKLHLLWYDPEHKVSPSPKKNT